MEVYILDDLLRRETVIDRFESLIWTEKFSAVGDFQLVIHSTADTRRLLILGKRLAINASKRVMTIETIVDADDSEGRSMLKITGRSLEAILMERVNRKTFSSNSVPVATWSITNKPAVIARTIFNDICVNNTAFPGDKIPFYVAGSLYPANTIAEPDQTVTMEFGYGSVYDSIKNVVDIYGMGFRLVRNFDESELYFNVYTGNDRTTTQTTLAPVIFSPDLENLVGVSQLSSIEPYKNVAYVFAKNGSAVVYSLDADPSVEGLNRRVMYVDATDITLAAGVALDNALAQRGKDALAQQKNLYVLDGELSQTSKYRYDVDYSLGDLVEMRSDAGVINRMRVTEQIFVDDAEGERSYPTLAVDLFITPGSWYAWDYNQVWDDADEEWADA